MTAKEKINPAEDTLMEPVLRLFPRRKYYRFIEVPLGRKKVDLWCVSKINTNSYICIELKVENWRKALWQAAINFQIGKQSYIAIWHRYVHRVEKHARLLSQYGVGLIAVKQNQAEIIIPSQNQDRASITRDDRQKFFSGLISV